MRDLRSLAGKVKKVASEDGIAAMAARTKGYLERTRRERIFEREKSRSYRDVLFISGCNENLPHPHRYRVLHQMEQLRANGLSCDTVYFQELSPDQVRCYTAFLFFRCPMTETIDTFLREARRLHKPVWYDVDDLVVDTCYTDQIAWLSSMESGERAAYDENVRNMGRLLTACDGAITTTACLAKELKNYVADVRINRNCASEEMLALSENVFRTVNRRDRDRVVLGYFSGSATHLDDIRMILPVLVRTLELYPNVELSLIGILEVPRELQRFGARVQTEGFMDYRKLPEKISEVDINLAPLTDTVFNAAKSENKWVEAALVRVPTIASRLGAFEEMVEDGVTGMLCTGEEEWCRKLSILIESGKARRQIGEAAYSFCRAHCITTYTGGTLAAGVRGRMNLRCGFILPALTISGGVRVALQHARMLWKTGAQISLFVLEGEEKWYDDPVMGRIPVLSADTGRCLGSLDLAVATMWNTLEFAEHCPNVRRRIYLVQNYEVDFYPPQSPYRIAASATYHPGYNVSCATVSRWCEVWLRERYGTHAVYLPNGINNGLYSPKKRDLTGKIRILIEGDCTAAHKNVDESFRIVEQLPRDSYEIWYLSYGGEPKEWYRVDRFFHQIPYEETPKIYESCDILLKTSLLESFSYPPLEMMASGGYVVAIANEGNREYLLDEENCLFYGRGRIKEALAAISRLREDTCLQQRLYENGLRTARARDWEVVSHEILQFYLGENI